jgi:hypothetical protein
MECAVLERESMHNVMTYSSNDVVEFLADDVFSGLVGMFAEKIVTAGLKNGDFNSYLVVCKDGVRRRFILVLEDEDEFQRVYVMTIDEAMEMPATAAAIRKELPHLVGSGD